MSPVLKVLPLVHYDSALALPAYESDGAAGMDLRACLAPEDRSGLILPSLGRAMVSTGLSMEIPKGFEGQVRPRSGLAAKHGLTVLNSPGTIDSDYRGELKVLLVNLGAENFTLTHGERIAQLVIAPVVQADVQVADALTTTDRGSGGFGSTGTE
ncbi:MAG: dUTP diphosphatase [Pseudomonadota bacterium]